MPRVVYTKQESGFKNPTKKAELRQKSDRKIKNQRGLEIESYRAHGKSNGIMMKPVTQKKEADKATAISSARRPAAAAKVAEKARKVEGKAAAQKKLSATADKAHLKSNASLAALPNKLDAAAAAKKATAISSARGAKIAAAKAKSTSGTVEVNMSNGTTYYRKKPKK
jgi:hypothetical protein